LKQAALSLVFGGLLCGVASADEIVFPQALERNRSAEVVYRFGTPAVGHGFLDIEWSDAVGRMVERRRISLDLSKAFEVPFTLDIRRAVTIKQQLTVHLLLDQSGQKGNEIDRENRESSSFIVPPSDNPWSDYQIIMWQPQTPAGYRTLKKLGITAGMVETDHRDESSIYNTEHLDRLIDADLRCYLENIATDFYSPYHKWYDGRPVNWRFLEAKQRYWENRRGLGAFFREPSLSDPEWLQKIQDRLSRSVRALRPYRPLYYSLGDETGIGDLAAFWDFDFSPRSLAGMRDWLNERYGSLAALNEQWGTAFGRWEQVEPMTTDEAMKRSDQNFSAWADFKEWINVVFARALKSGTDAVHAADSNAVSAIEGGQIPGWGGYDYSRLAHSVDAVELYDYGDNIDIVRSFNPELIMLTTSFNRGPGEAHRVWRELLRGARGLVLWDENNEFVGRDGSLGERGREAASYFSEIRRGLGVLLSNSQRHTDPIAILYSPASMRVQWLLDRRATGEDWSRRDASTEYQEDAIRMSTRSFARALEHMGLQHRFISSDELRRGELQQRNYRILFLPHTIAVAQGEAKEIRDFVERGGVVIADGEPGVFDEHGRRVTNALLSQVFHGPATRSGVNFAFGKGKAIYLSLSNGRYRESTQRIDRILETAGMRTPFPVVGADGRPTNDVETHIYKNGGLTVVALQRDFRSRSIPGSRETVVLTLPRPFNVYDLREQKALGNTERLELKLGSVEPVLLALSEQTIVPPSITGPRSAHLGETAEFRIRSDSSAERHVVRLDVIDPDDNAVAHYSGNLLFADRETTRLLPLAWNDKAGVWKLRARDVLTGEVATALLRVEP
jgi:hypothetical protein